MKDRDLQRQLSFGLSAVVNHYGFSSDLFRDEDAQMDPVIDNGGRDKGVYFNANFGTYFLWDRFFAGLSIANLLPTEMEELGENEPVPPMTFFIFAGYTIPVNETIDIEPAAMFKFNENDERQLSRKCQTPKMSLTGCSWPTVSLSTRATQIRWNSPQWEALTSRASTSVMPIRWA